MYTLQDYKNTIKQRNRALNNESKFDSLTAKIETIVQDLVSQDYCVDDLEMIEYRMAK